VQDALTSNATNVIGTLNVLLAARDHGVRRVVCASSSSVYGSAVGTDAKSEDQPAVPISPYATTKLAGEGYARSFHEVYGLETVTLRYFNVFGPRQDPISQYAAVIPNFITALLAGQQPVIFGDGEQSPDFTYAAPRAGDIKHSLADLNRARAELGYEPAVELRDGLERTIEHLRDEERRARAVEAGGAR